MSQTAPSHSPLEEVADFFARGPSLAEIAQFRLSDAALAWISELLEREDEGSLSAEEKHQLDELLTINDLVTLIRSRASSPDSLTVGSRRLSVNPLIQRGCFPFIQMTQPPSPPQQSGSGG